MLHSQDFTQAVWALDNSGAVNPVVTANYGAAPDGTMTADRIQLNKTGGTFCRIQQVLTGLTSGSYTISVWMRTISGTANVGLRNDATGINCVVTTTWQRFSLTIGPTTVAGVQILLFDSIPGNDETADILAWGGQLELGAFPSSPIVTVAAAATRASDVLTYTAGVSYPLSLWAEFTPLVSNAALNEGILTLDPATSSNRVEMMRSTADTLRSVIDSGGVSQVDISGGAIANNVNSKAAFRVLTNDFKAALNGTITSSDTSLTYPAASPTQLLLGVRNGGGSPLFGYVRRLAVFNSALTDAQLTASTT
jgi:hypothetical protein